MNTPEYYQENGYAVVRDVIDSKLIEQYLNSIRYAVSDRLNYVWTQDTHTYERLSYNDEGLIEFSIQNPHRYPWRKQVRNLVAEIITNEKIIDALNNITNDYSNKGVWQTMYFDKSTGTLGHQDSYYLDTEPYGGVVGVWFALEDISLESGPFYMIPKSHKHGPLFNSQANERYADHDEYVEKLGFIEEENKSNIKPMLVNKGDVIIWSSTTIHGALNASVKHASRKSLTAHYFPLNSKLKWHDQIPKVGYAKGQSIPIMGFPSNKEVVKEKMKLLTKVFLQSIFGKKPTLEMRR